jgi:3-hydroxyisobutyrate dehydrogenase
VTAVAVLGLGVMGWPIARRLAATGHRVTAWNRTPGRVDVTGTGITEAADPGAAVEGAEFVLTVLADDDALTAVIGSIAGRLAAGQTVVNLGTVSSATVRALADSVSVVDAGMLGNAVHAGEGNLRCYVGGTPEQVEHVRPLLSDIAKEVVHVGALGAGMDLKLVLNLLMGLEMQALAEVTALGESLGLDRGLVLETVSGSGFSAPVMGFKSRRMAAGRYGRPDFRLALMAKDLRLAVRAASGTALPMSLAAQEAHAAAVTAGWGDLDCAAITDALAGAAPAERHRAGGGRP